MKLMNILFSLFCFAIFLDLYLIYSASPGLVAYGKYIESAIFVFGLLGFLTNIKLHKKENKLRINHAAEIQKIMGERDALAKKSQEAAKSFENVIEIHFSVWKLTDAEKTIALYILRGLNSKEISELRKVSEKTIKNQFYSIYSKSGLSGKHDLAAYFLKELLG